MVNIGFTIGVNDVVDGWFAASLATEFRESRQRSLIKWISFGSAPSWKASVVNLVMRLMKRLVPFPFSSACFYWLTGVFKLYNFFCYMLFFTFRSPRVARCAYAGDVESKLMNIKAQSSVYWVRENEVGAIYPESKMSENCEIKRDRRNMTAMVKSTWILARETTLYVTLCLYIPYLDISHSDSI